MTKLFKGTNGMFDYEVIARKTNNSREFKMRSVSADSSMYESDSDFENKPFMNLGYYEAKSLLVGNFSDQQINEMFNLTQG